MTLCPPYTTQSTSSSVRDHKAVMKVQEALAWAQRQLKTSKTGTPRLDALVLLEDATGINRAKLLAEPDLVLASSVIGDYKAKVRLRCTAIPLAYVRRKTEFYGREFYIDQRVLEPRPESETLIEEAIKLIRSTEDKVNVVDVGTGSGALIITLKLECPEIVAIATDISQECLDVATINAHQYSTNVRLLKGNLLLPINEGLITNKTLVVANLPYVPDSWQINPSAMSEPSLAIFGGKDGLRLYTEMFSQLGKLKHPPLYVLTEAMPPQQDQLLLLASSNNYKLLKTNDFIQVFNFSV